jgi:hypothetical protein
LTEGFSPLNRDKELDRKRKKVRCAAQFLNSYDFVAHDNTERMFVQELTRGLQFIMAARGDVRDSNGMFLKTLGYSESFLGALESEDPVGGGLAPRPATWPPRWATCTR